MTKARIIPSWQNAIILLCGSVVSVIMVIALLWIYYSAQLMLFGAKFTQVYSDMNNAHVEPIPGAEAVTVEKVVSEHRPPA